LFFPFLIGIEIFSLGFIWGSFWDSLLVVVVVVGFNASQLGGYVGRFL